VTSAIKELRSHWSTLIVLPTGAGKTVVFCEIAKRWHHGRVLILAHREELVMQAAAKIEQATGEKPVIEMAEQTAGGEMFGVGGVVVGSVQSICRPRRLAKHNPEEFGLVIVDEAHHCTPQNASYHAIVEHFRVNPNCRLLGVTATPDRGDKLALGQVFETVAYEMTILDAINGGYLVPIEQQFVRVNGLDFSKVRTTAGDLNATDLESLLNQDGGRMLHEIASATVDAAKDEPTLIFANSVASAEAIAKIVCRYPGKVAKCLHGKTPKEERRYHIEQFSQGAYQFLVGCDLFLEGFDSPRISVVANAKPTKSRARYTQCVGRGTRILPGVINDASTADERRAAILASAKPRLLVLDFVGNSAQHKLISTLDVLGGEYKPAAVLEALKAIEEDGATNVQDALRRSAEKIAKAEALALSQQMEARRKAEEAERARMAWLRAHPEYALERVDPFGDSSGVGSYSGGMTARRSGPTDAMRSLLERNGVITDGMSFSEASAAIAALKQSWAGQAATPKQKSLLEKFGEDPRVTSDQAKVLIDLIVARGWQRRNYKLTRDKWAMRQGPDGQWSPVVIDPSVGNVPISKSFRTEKDCREFIGRCVEGDANAA
jgi:superfamily II DNA or RNA helicase